MNQAVKPDFCMSILLHRGRYPKAAQVGSIGGIPVIGTVGTNDPSVWLHILPVDGVVYRAKLKCEFIDHRPQLEELWTHFQICQGQEYNPWKPHKP